MNDTHRLRQAGLKVTLPRLKILELFSSSSKRHLSVDEVYRHLLEADVEVGLATVYRVLAQLAQTGLLRRSELGEGKAVFEPNDGHTHDHLVCVDCGQVYEFFDSELGKEQAYIVEKMGFSLVRRTHVLHATCQKQSCRHGVSGNSSAQGLNKGAR